jgi:hypothetical protein
LPPLFLLIPRWPASLFWPRCSPAGGSNGGRDDPADRVEWAFDDVDAAGPAAAANWAAMLLAGCGVLWFFFLPLGMIQMTESDRQLGFLCVKSYFSPRVLFQLYILIMKKKIIKTLFLNTLLSRSSLIN